MEFPDLVEPDLWQRYRCDDDAEARDRLFLHYAPWATAIARGVHRRVRAYQVDREDFIQNATIGLLDAMARFDMTRGIPFRSYAQPRVRGAVFNGLRAIVGDRPQRADEARFASRLQSLQPAGRVGSAFEQVLDDIVGLGIGFLLDEAVAESDGTLANAHAAQLESRLLLAVAQLPDRLKLIVRAHYFQHVPFIELAVQLGLTKGRISQLHKKALLQLRQSLAPGDRETSAGTCMRRA
jgi:RNA polymerase sigma factor for flagellar operon FliA